MLREDDKVRITETGEIGFVSRVLDGGERVIVRIPSSTSWPFPCYAYVDKEKIRRVKIPKQAPMYEPAPF